MSELKVGKQLGLRKGPRGVETNPNVERTFCIIWVNLPLLDVFSYANMFFNDVFWRSCPIQKATLTMHIHSEVGYWSIETHRNTPEYVSIWKLSKESRSTHCAGSRENRNVWSFFRAFVFFFVFVVILTLTNFKFVSRMAISETRYGCSTSFSVLTSTLAIVAWEEMESTGENGNERSVTGCIHTLTRARRNAMI